MTLFTPEKELLLAVELPVRPRVKGRPRATKNGHMYTPEETRAAEAELRSVFQSTLGPDFEPFSDPIEVNWLFYNDHYRLDVWSHWDYTQRQLRGDVDNYMKLGSDALNKLAWEDDRLIVATRGEKM